MKKYGVFIFLLAWFCNALGTETTTAQTIHPKIAMTSLKAIKPSEKNGDELYLTVTEYSSSGKSAHVQFPSYPEFWPSEKLSQVKDIILWDKELKNNESVVLVISLIEQDAPPLNPDDLIGTVRVMMKNNHGKLESKWIMTNKNDVITQKSNEQYQGQWFGDGSHYEFNFSIKES